jgi:predicted lipoprotein with Yx(FWY)xxD motif
MTLIATAGVATAVLAGGLALARSHQTLRTASNATIGKTIVVNSKGLTVYELRPETSRHLLCTKTSGCLSEWPPVTVASAKSKITAAPGVKGKLRILHRNGVFQVTLAGRPLYRFRGDSSTRGAAKGQGLQSFGGTWHVVAAGAAGGGVSTNPDTTDTTATTTTPGYTYPTYP